MEKRLSQAGFRKLEYTRQWQLERGGSYYVTIRDTSCLAFRIAPHCADKTMPYFRIVSAHTCLLYTSVVDGLHYSKALFIISDCSQEIAERLIKELDRGATGIGVTGKYTGQQREMLFVVMSVKETVTAKRIVKELDPGAFMMITDTKEVLGEGFTEH